MRYVVVGGLATEELSGELLLCDASGTAVHRIAGDARRYFEQVAGGDGELPDDQVTAALVAANAIVPVDVTAASLGTDGMSRRKVMALGAAAAAAAGVVTVGLPSAAAAQSPGPGPAPEPSFPGAPASGTNPVDPGGDTAIPVNNRTDRVNVSWTNFDGVNETPVTFNYRLYSPGTAVGGSPVSGNLIAEGGPVDGWLGVAPDAVNGIFVPGVVAPQTIMWLLVAPNGAQRIVTGSFS